MGIARALERRGSPENPSISLTNPSSWARDIWGGADNFSGAKVTHENALHVAAFWRGVQLIADALAVVPLKVYEEIEPKGRNPVKSLPVYRMLHDRPNPWMSSFQFRRVLQAHRLTWGNAYAEIEMDGAGRPVALWPLLPDRTSPYILDGRKVFRTRLPTGEFATLERERVLHVPGLGFDGIVGYSVIAMARQSLGLTRAAEEFGARFYGSGTRLSGVLEHPGQLGEKAMANLRRSMDKDYQGLSQSHRVMILEEGMKFNPQSIPPNDAQFLETRKFQSGIEVARWVGCPPHKLYDLDRATFSNIEHQGIEFAQDTMLAHYTAWEQELDEILPRGPRGQRLVARFTVDALERADMKTRFESYSVARSWGWMSANDILELENRNPIENGDIYLQPLNMVEAGTEPELSPPDEPTEPPEPRDAPAAREERARADDAERRERRRARAVADRSRLRSAFRPLLMAAAARVVRREVEAGRRAVRAMRAEGVSTSFDEWIQRFYEDHGDYYIQQMRPVLVAYAEAVESTAEAEVEVDPEDGVRLDEFAASYTETAARRHVGSSAGQLRAITDEGGTVDGMAEALEQRLGEWEERRPAKMADRDVVEGGAAFAKFAFAAFGVSALRWRANSGACPLCVSLDGRTAQITGHFLAPGDTVTPEGGDTAPLTTKTLISHPPLHGGCECDIVAE